MNQKAALELARLLLRPTSALGYLVTRGPGWPPAAECAEYKTAVGRVMGNAYGLLQPVWDEHPDLDPGSSSNRGSLDLVEQPNPALTSPAGLLAYLEEADSVLSQVVSSMLADPSISRHRTFIEDSARELSESIAQAKQTFSCSDSDQV